MGSQDPRTEPPASGSAREDARIEAFKLIIDVQAAVPTAVQAIDRLLNDALARDWPEVVRAGMFAAAVAAVTLDSEQRLPAIERLLHQAEADGDHVMIALALVMRSSVALSDAHAAAARDADADLARATILLESAPGDALERMTAHNECAQAFCDRWLWELGDEQYATILGLVPADRPAWLQYVLPALVYNQAEMQVDWACAQHQLGDENGVADRWRTWESAMAAAAGVDMPDKWRTELAALGVLLAAICGRDVTDVARAQITALAPEKHVRAWPIGHLQLAIALNEQRAGNLPAARQAAEAAASSIDPHGSPDTYDLALFVAAELEASGGHGRGFRYGRRQVEQRSANRAAALGSMRSRLQSERLRTEHALLSRHAHLDDLTGLSNRRGFERYLAAVEHQGIETVALLLVDLDGFKAVNDRFGHAAGDAVLTAVARVLEASVRQADCAVRFGGDEFAVLLAAADLAVARTRADTIAEAVRKYDWEAIAPGLTVSLSIGLMAGSPQAISELMAGADSALYEAKAAGGHRIIGGRPPRVPAPTETA
ncbi:MAG: GGDEF domain-containing protein [Acidimicrobiales bacterium]